MSLTDCVIFMNRSNSALRLASGYPPCNSSLNRPKAILCPCTSNKLCNMPSSWSRFLISMGIEYLHREPDSCNGHTTAREHESQERTLTWFVTATWLVTSTVPAPSGLG